MYECASYIQDARAVAINPQINIHDYSYSNKFSEITGNQLKNDKWHRDSAAYFLKHNRNQQYILIVNLRSAEDMEQVQHLCDELSIKVKYGINYYQEYCLLIWIYDGDMEPLLAAHSTQEFYCIFMVIMYLVDTRWEGGDRSLFLLFNEFWYDRYQSEKNCRLEYKTPNMEIAHKCHEEKRVVAVWGLGKKFKFIEKYLLDVSGQNYYRIQCIIDANKSIPGSKYKNIKVIHPDEIQDWSLFYVVILSEDYCKEISMQLESWNMKYKRDYITYNDLFY